MKILSFLFDFVFTKKSFVILSAFLGISIFSSPLLAMKREHEDEKRGALIHPLEDAKIVEHTIKSLPIRNLVIASGVSKLWNECVFGNDSVLGVNLFNTYKDEILGMFSNIPMLNDKRADETCYEDPYKNEGYDENTYHEYSQRALFHEILQPRLSAIEYDKRAVVSLFCLKNIFKKNRHFFPPNSVSMWGRGKDEDYDTTADSIAHDRMKYTLDIVCGSALRSLDSQEDLSIYEWLDVTNIPDNQIISYFSDILENSIDAKHLILNAGPYDPCGLMDKECAKILGGAIGRSSLESFSLIDAYFDERNLDALPTLLNAASKNTYLKDVSIVRSNNTSYSEPPHYEEAMVDSLLKNLAPNISFVLTMPMDLIGHWVDTKEEYLELFESNKKMREKLTDHFREKIKFVGSEDIVIRERSVIAPLDNLGSCYSPFHAYGGYNSEWGYEMSQDISQDINEGYSSNEEEETSEAPSEES